ncbi:MAG: thiol-disulfide isomerase/thioredoxin, partial [Flavobacteriales bacterium]
MIIFSKRVVFVCVSFWALLLSPISSAVDSFVLLDQNGEAQDLFYDKQSKAIVVMIHGNGCQIIRSILPDFNALRDEYEAKGVRFIMLNANLQDSRETIASEALEWGIEMPILIDSAQIIGPSLGVTRTAEVLVINAVSREISYRGAINDRVYYERQKKEASEHYVKNALDAVLAGEQVAVSEVKSVGCIVNFPSRDQEISYSDTIAPLLVNNCVACHQQGGIAPWAMSEYRMVQGFAPMMREVVRTKRMPPWHADPEIGEWQHDAGLSAEETNILINWIEAGAKRGDGEDPLVAFKPSQQ